MYQERISIVLLKLILTQHLTTMMYDIQLIS